MGHSRGRCGPLAPRIPSPTGIPQVEIFTLQPLQLGKPNTLVCSVTNVFPPSATISWQHQDKPVDLGVTTTQIYPIQTLDFQIFSYLEVTPQERDVYSCTVKTPRSKFSSMAFWVPKDPIASQLLEDVLCGLGCGVGILFTVMGLALIALALRFRRGCCCGDKMEEENDVSCLGPFVGKRQDINCNINK
uniref:Ig-like domain-containing protein n=1 Tax=Varanus komodoensis TaxID=61221 RepID=A0A8D2IL54_VARKO